MLALGRGRAHAATGTLVLVWLMWVEIVFVNAKSYYGKLYRYFFFSPQVTSLQYPPPHTHTYTHSRDVNNF